MLPYFIKRFLEYFLPGTYAMLLLEILAFICISLIARQSYALVLVAPVTFAGILMIFILGIVNTAHALNRTQKGSALTKKWLNYYLKCCWS